MDSQETLFPEDNSYTEPKLKLNVNYETNRA